MDDNYQLLENLIDKLDDGIDNFQVGNIEIKFSFEEACLLRKLVKEAQEE